MPNGWESVISNLVDKVMARKILLYGFIPESPASLELAEAERSEMVFWNSDDFEHIDFAKLLSGMGKSISVSSLQSTKEPNYSKALFGEDAPDFLANSVE